MEHSQSLVTAELLGDVVDGVVGDEKFLESPKGGEPLEPCDLIEL